MNYIAIENKLHDILQRACHYSDMATAERAIAPLAWYIGTDRAPLDFLRALCNTQGRQVTTIAKRLLKHASGDYSDALNSVREYIMK